MRSQSIYHEALKALEVDAHHGSAILFLDVLYEVLNLAWHLEPLQQLLVKKLLVLGVAEGNLSIVTTVALRSSRASLSGAGVAARLPEQCRRNRQ